MRAFVFPGQGSQVRGMGGELFTEFADLTATADTILGYSIQTLCLNDPEQKLNQTQFTQPALYVVNALMYFKKLQTDSKPDYVAGHSLGEYNALLAAEVFDFATGLQLVKKRGELMSTATGGAMAAIVGLPVEEVKTILQASPFKQVTVANYNSHTQCVISGVQHEIEEVKTHFKNGSFIPLKVSGAFHSPLMLNAQNQFAEFLEQFNFATPVIPVIANVDAKPYHPAIVKHNLAQQITSSVRWSAIVEYLLAKDSVEFVEVGPGNVLSRLIQQMSMK